MLDPLLFTEAHKSTITCWGCTHLTTCVRPVHWLTWLDMWTHVCIFESLELEVLYVRGWLLFAMHVQALCCGLCSYLPTQTSDYTGKSEPGLLEPLVQEELMVEASVPWWSRAHHSLKASSSSMQQCLRAAALRSQQGRINSISDDMVEDQRACHSFKP